MLLLPAIDIRGGKCVRLQQGDFGRETIFGSDVAEVARRWADEGAAGLHLVDLDGARTGEPVNQKAVAAIVAAVDVPCQLGGGLRTAEHLQQAFDLGLAKAIVGTQALREPVWFGEMAERFAGRLLLGLDCKNGMVATHGWLDVSALPALELLRQFEALPLGGVIYTDVAKDGMLQGPNFEQTAAIAQATRHMVIASGGIADQIDVIRLCEMGIPACILGRSIYEGRINLRSLIQYLEGKHPH